MVVSTADRKGSRRGQDADQRNTPQAQPASAGVQFWPAAADADATVSAPPRGRVMSRRVLKLSADVAALVGSYRPVGLTDHEAAVLPVVMPLVRAAVPAALSTARTLLWATTRLALWAYLTLGSVDPAVVLHPPQCASLHGEGLWRPAGDLAARGAFGAVPSGTGREPQRLGSVVARVRPQGRPLRPTAMARRPGSVWPRSCPDAGIGRRACG